MRTPSAGIGDTLRVTIGAVMRAKRRFVLLSCLACACAAVCGAGTLSAQQSHTIRGRVIAADDAGGLAGISVSVGPGRIALTDAMGRFAIPRLPSGRYMIEVSGVGYARADTALVLTRDTTLVITLDRIPVDLGALAGTVRHVTVRGRVTEERFGAMVTNAEVFASEGRRAKTGIAGTFKLTRIPTNGQLEVRVESFGYLPAVSIFQPDRDTTLEMVLKPDPVAQAMIRQQLQKIDERSADRRYAQLSVLDRDSLLSERDHGLLMDVIRFKLGRMAGKISCIMVDENPYHHWRAAALLADEVQRVEILKYGLLNGELMVRIYTREFMRDMTGGAATLVPRKTAMYPPPGWSLRKGRRNAAQSSECR